MNVQAAREIFDYDPAHGVLRWKKHYWARMVGEQAGTRGSTGYWGVHVGGRAYVVHRLIWLLATGSWPTGVIDHIDGDRGNNRLENLRDVPPYVNSQNMRRPMASNRTSAYLGVSFEKRVKRFRADIKLPGKKAQCLGRFDTPEEAQAVYLAAKRQHHAGCTI